MKKLAAVVAGVLVLGTTTLALSQAGSTAPGLAGAPAVGQTLHAGQGTWGNNPTSFTYQWQRCASSCTNIAGATAPTYVVASADVGDSIDVVVTASNTGGSSSQTSAQTAPVLAPAGCTNSVSCWPNSSNTGYQNAPGYPGTPGVADPTKLTTASSSSSTCPLTFQSNHTYSFCRYTGAGQFIGSSTGHLTNVHFIGDLFESSDHTSDPATIMLYCDSNCTFDYMTMKPQTVNAPNIAGRHGTTYAASYGAIMGAGWGAFGTVGHGLSITHSDIWGFDSGIILGPNGSATPVNISDNWLHDQGDCINAGSCTSHADGIGMVDTGSSSSYVTLNHNNMPFIEDNTNDIAFQSGTYDHLTITNNLFSGDGYTIAIWSTSTNITFTGNVYTNYAQNWFGMNYGQDFWDTPGSVWAHNKFLWDTDPLSVQGTYFQEGPQNGNAGPITSADSGKCWVPDGLSTTDYHGGVC